jgi:hypothetical protein
MIVAIIPSAVFAGTVYADGKQVGTIAQTASTRPFEGLDGQTHVGTRWLPEGLDVNLTPGPVTKAEAALLLLALEGHDPAQAVRSLGLAS